jgi:hypothetical protein
MRNIILSLSVAIVSMNCAVAIDKQSCEAKTYDPAAVASDPLSPNPSPTTVQHYKFCSGSMTVAAAPAVTADTSSDKSKKKDLRRMFPVIVSGTGNDEVCKSITYLISNDKADREYLEAHKQLNFRACLKPRDAVKLAQPGTAVGINDASRSVVREEEKTLINKKLYGNNPVLAKIMERDMINQIFRNQDDKDDRGNIQVLPGDGEDCKYDIINDLSAYSKFLDEKFNKKYPDQASYDLKPLTCGEFLDTYVMNPFKIPDGRDKFNKNQLKSTPGGELILAIEGEYVPYVDQFPDFKQAAYAKLKNEFTWKEFLDKVISSPYADKLEVSDGHEFRSIE